MKRPRSIAHAAVVCLLGLLVPATAPGAADEKRLALVIGNSAYRDAPLMNPVNDARAMSARLKQLGFDVVARENATRAHVAAAVAEFTARITPSTVALLYYAGHGLQVRGRNYLIPVDAEIEAESAVPFAAIDVAQIIDEIDHAGARVKVMVLDACRNNPFERRLRGVGQGRGLAPMQAARGSLMAFATAPGSVAADGDGVNSIYTGALLVALAEPGMKAEDVFKRARLMVLEQTRGAQTPWEQSALTGELVLNRASAAPAVAPTAKPEAEAIFWQSAQTSHRVDEYRAYLAQYPQGAFAALARARIAALLALQPTAAASAAPPPKIGLVGAAKAAEIAALPPPPRKAVTEPAPAAGAPAPRAAAPAAEPPLAAEPAPAPPATAEVPPPAGLRQVAAVIAPSAKRAAPDLVQAMMRRADQLIAVNDLGAARLFYERLALEGHRPAALALARSYDPGWLRQHKAYGAQADPARAAYWYGHAEAMADPADTGAAR